MSQRDDRVRKALGGQSAPPSHDGRGQQILFCCPVCQQYGLVDGRTWYARIDEPEAQAIARRLGIALAQALPFTCKPCLRDQHLGLFEVDEYFVEGLPPGFGLSWESDDPPGSHALCLLLPLALLPHLLGVRADIPTQILDLERALQWVSTASPARARLRALPPTMLSLLVLDNPPGHGTPGTERWHWEGCFWPDSIAGAPLLVQMCQAMPPGEPFDPHLTIQLWHVIASNVR